MSKHKQGLYLITEGGYTGRIGHAHPKCICRECTAAKKAGYLRLRFMDMSTTLVTGDECEFVCTPQEATEIVNSFSDGTPIGELPEGTSELIRETLQYQAMLIDSYSIGDLFEVEVRDGVEVPPEMRN